MAQAVQQPLTAVDENTLDRIRRKLFGLAEAKGCVAEFKQHNLIKSLNLVMYRDGRPWTTVYFGMFPRGMSDVQCMRETVRRLVEEPNATCFFDRIGVPKVSSYEELELNLSVMGA